MNLTDESASVAMGMIKEATFKALDITKELLKIMLLKAAEIRNRDKALIGANNTINRLLSDGHQLNAPILIDARDADLVHRLASEYQVPLAIVKSNQGQGFRVFFRQSDQHRVGEMMKELLQEKLKMESSMLQVVISKEEASFFKHRAKSLGIPVTFMENNGKIKVGFQGVHEKKVKAILQDIDAEKRKIPLRKIRIEASSIKISDLELKKSLSVSLPITKNAFVDAMQKFGYSQSEALDLAVRVESQQKFEWKPEIPKSIQRLERDIQISNESDSIKGFSFSTLELTDNTKMLTIHHKESGKMFSTFVTNRDQFVSSLKFVFNPLDENTVNDLALKAQKLGFVSDQLPEKSMPKIEIRTSRHANTASVRYKDRNVKIPLNDPDRAISLIQTKLILDNHTAAKVYREALSRNVKQIMESVAKKSKTIGSIPPLVKEKGER